MISVIRDAPYYVWPIIGQADAEILESGYADDCLRLRFSVSLFFPEGGGQGCDTGCVIADGKTWRIMRVEANADIVWCTVSKPDSLSSDEFIAQTSALIPGKKVTLVLDREVRMHNAVCHSAQHLLSAVLLRLFDAATVSMHLGASENTIDVEITDFNSDQARLTERTIAEIIEDDLPITIHLCPPEDISAFNLRKKVPDTDGIIRVVDIGGIDYSPCCGTHVVSTGRIGLLRVIGWEKYKGLTRISFVAGHDAWEFDSAVRDILVDCASEAGTNPFDLPAKIAAYKESGAKLTDELKLMQNRWIESEGVRLFASAADSAFLQAEYDRLPSDLLRRAQTEWCRQSGKAVLIADKTALKLFCVSPQTGAFQVHLKEALSDVFSECGAKGGGGVSVMQGSFESPELLERCFLLCAHKLTELYHL